MNIKVYKNVKLNNRVTDITVSGGKIVSVEPTADPGRDMGGASVFPGLIDIHIHGGLGLDVTYDKEAVKKLSLYLAKNGVTTWYPTLVAEDINILRKATAQKTDFPGANVPGFHLEGPYITNPGAMKREVLKKPDIKEFSTFTNVKMITVAPEVAGACEFIKNCGAVVSLGHTDCDYKAALNAFESGAVCVTHLFNVMPPMHHREPGLIGAAVEKNAYVQIICDGIHIHRSVVLAAYKIFGADRMILISDAMAPMGTKDNAIYEQNGKRMIVKDGVARTEEGRLYGSAGNLLDGVKRAISFGIERDEAFKMASYTPAKLMGLNKGELKPGRDADMIAVDDENNVILSVVNGKEV